MVEAAIEEAEATASERPGARATARRSALDARHVRPRVEPDLRRRVGPQRRATRDPQELLAPAPPRSSGWSTPTCCRCRRFSCSAERSATISDGAACWSSGRHCSRRHRWSARSRLTSSCCSPAAALKALARPATAQQPRPAQRRLRGRETRPRRRHLGRGRSDAAAVAPLIGGWLVDNVGWPASSTSTFRLAAARSCSL